MRGNCWCCVVVEIDAGANSTDDVVSYADDYEMYIGVDVRCVCVVFLCVGIWVNGVVCRVVDVVDVVEIVVHVVVVVLFLCCRGCWCVLLYVLLVLLVVVCMITFVVFSCVVVVSMLLLVLYGVPANGVDVIDIGIANAVVYGDGVGAVHSVSVILLVAWLMMCDMLV